MQDWRAAMDDVSVVIPSYNSHATIGRTLEALLGQNQKAREIVVVDSSDDGLTAGVLEGFGPRGVRVMRLARKTIPAVGRNLGARECSGSVLAFVDSDAYPAPDWVSGILEAVRRGRRVGGGSVEMPPFQVFKTIALAQYYLQFNEFLPAGRERKKSFVPSVNLFCERSLFQACGGFPELRAAEDVTFGINVNRMEPLWFVPSLRVSHIFREKMGPFLRNQELLGEYVIRYRRAHSDSFLYKGLVPAVLFPAILAVKALRMLARSLTAGPSHWLPLVLSLPLFFVGLLAWSGGFLKGCVRRHASA